MLLVLAHTDEVKDEAFTKAVMNRIKATNLSTVIQKTATLRERSIFFKLRHLPKAMIVLFAVVVIAALSGTAYAVFTLWPKPSVHTQPAVTNQFGRTQIIASLDNCSTAPKESTYEIKKGGTLQPNEVSKVLQAKCEGDTIRDWVSKLPGGESMGAGDVPTDGEIVNYTNLSSVAAEVTSLTATQLMLAHTGNEDTDSPLALSPDTKYIVDGNDATREAIKPGDTVFFVENMRSQFSVKPKGDGNFTLDTTTLKKATSYVIKVDQPATYYQAIKQDQIIARTPCDGNPQDSCLNGGSVDIYQDLSLYDKFTKEQQAVVTVRTLQGEIVSHTGNSLVLQTSSGRRFTLSLPYDILAQFNTHQSSGYNNIQIGIGDTLNVDYYDTNKDTHSTSLDSAHIATVTLAIDFINKTDPLKKY